MKKILLVNTSRYFFDEGKDLLERKDFKVFTAASAMQALQIHRQEQVNLIVAELNMPEMGGDKLCATIRQESAARTVSFILIYHDNPEEHARANRCGANICLHKPFTARTLLEQVEKLMTISVRKGYRVLLRAKVKGAKEDTVFFCTSQNISASGMLIETDRALLQGEQLTCAFFLPGAEHIMQISADCEVARTEKLSSGTLHYCGLRFVSISAEHKSEIEKFITTTMSTAEKSSGPI